MVRKLYPGGKAKAVNFSYDDGVTQDLQFVPLLNKYGMKGTFNLNSKLLLEGFTWVHPCGKTISRLPREELVSLYEGHEIASHTATHPMMQNISEEEILEEMVSDKEKLEEIFGREVVGFALPFSYHDDRVYRCSKAAGFAYARISDESMDFSIPSDFHRWVGTMFHIRPELEDCLDRFLATDQELALFHLLGHSYDLDVEDMWDRLEAVMAKLSKQTDIWPATHIAIVRYLQAMEKAEITEKEVINNSDADLWFLVDGEVRLLHPGEKECLV